MQTEVKPQGAAGSDGAAKVTSRQRENSRALDVLTAMSFAEDRLIAAGMEATSAQLTKARFEAAEVIAERDALRAALEQAQPVLYYTAGGRREMQTAAALVLPTVDAALARSQRG